jgi:hypothetical protein
MDEEAFQKKIAELQAELSTALGAKVNDTQQIAVQPAAKTDGGKAKLAKTVSSLQSSIDFLRLSIKYLIFDLEATRRENEYLRKMLEKEEPDSE